MSKTQGNTARHGARQSDWAADEFQTLCEDLLSRPILRRGPFMMQDRDLEAMITVSSDAGKLRRVNTG